MYKAFFLTLLFFPPNLAFVPPPRERYIRPYVGHVRRAASNDPLASASSSGPSSSIASVSSSASAATTAPATTTASSDTTATDTNSADTNSATSGSATATSAPSVVTSTSAPTTTSVSVEIITSTATAPAPATSSASTSALQLGQKLLSGSSSTCTASGGGCDMFKYILSDPKCTTDTQACADNATLSAMVCAQCNGNEDSVKAYNDYLGICVKEGVAKPSDTLTVSNSGSAAASTSCTSMGSNEDTKGSMTVTAAPKATSKADNVAALALATDTGSGSGSLTDSAGGNYDLPEGGGGGLLSNSYSMPTPLGSSSTATSINASAGIPTDSATSVAALQLGYTISSGSSSLPGPTTSASSASSTRAVISAKGYFSMDIDSKCDEECKDWKDASGSCSDDQCICTESTMLSASACSSCLGSTTHGTTYQKQMFYYTSFTGNCTSEVPNLSPSGLGKSSGYDMVPDASSTSGATKTGASVTAAGAGEAVVTVASNGQWRSLSVPHWSILVGTLSLGLGVSILIRTGS